MLNVALALILAGDDDGQAVFFAQPIADPAYLMVATLVRMVVLVVGEADRIENQMVVNMPFINMGGKYKLVLATQYFFCQLHSNLMGILGGDLSRLKGLDQVAAQVRTLVDGIAACLFKSQIQCRLFRRHSQRRTPAVSRLVCRDCRICISKQQFDELLESLDL